MQGLRTFWRDHRRLAMLLIALTLCLKAVMPAGYMLGGGARVLTIEICADATGHRITRQIVVPQDSRQTQTEQAAKKSATCPWSALSMATLAGADPALLAVALAFIIALGFSPATAPRLARLSHLRPPLRGPPALA